MMEYLHKMNLQLRKSKFWDYKNKCLKRERYIRSLFIYGFSYSTMYIQQNLNFCKGILSISAFIIALQSSSVNSCFSSTIVLCTLHFSPHSEIPCSYYRTYVRIMQEHFKRTHYLSFCIILQYIIIFTNLLNLSKCPQFGTLFII